MLTYDVAGGQIDGARDYQEDAFLITRLGDADDEKGGSLLIVADGMGGHAAGNVASNMAVQTFNKHLTANSPSDEMPTVLREAILLANESIKTTVAETSALKGMGCTIIAVVVADDQLRWVSVGDSHLYLVRDDAIRKINADHSYGGFLDRMAAEGKPMEPEAGFSRNMLMSALTGDEIAEIDCPTEALDLRAGDRLVLASDGLDTVSHAKIISFLEKSAGAKDCVDALLGAVADAQVPRQDNTTVVCAVVGQKNLAANRAGAAASPAVEAAPLYDHGPNATASAPPRRTGRYQSRALEIEQSSRRAGKWIVLALLAVLAAAGGAAYWALKPKPPVENDTSIDWEPATQVPEHAAEVEAPTPADEVESINELLEDAEQSEIAATPDEVDTTTLPAQPETFRDKLASGGDGPLMVRIPGGSYLMGAPDSSAEFNNRPQHAVKVTPFAIGVYEISIAEYLRFARAAGRRAPQTGDLDPDRFPAFFVSWNDALEYTKWLSAQTGRTYRLPSEAQWEYAARAGTSSNYWWGRKLESGRAHCFACDTGLDPRQPTKISRFAANRFGLHDTAGNVAEWVYDCWHKNYDGAPTDGSVFEGGDCTQRVVRGGAFSSGPKGLRSATREKFPGNRSNDSIGFRVVRLD